jgi:DNA-binding Xre family transcriptional regulator
MTTKLDYRWKLREVMALRGMFSTISMQPSLAERGIDLSSSQVYRLVTERPEQLSLKVLMALLDILECSMEDLIEPVATATSAPRPKKVVGGEEAAAGASRPKRARIVPRPHP